MKRCKDCNSMVDKKLSICPKCSGTNFYHEEQDLECKLAAQAYRGLLKEKQVFSEYIAFHYYQGKVIFLLMMIPMVIFAIHTFYLMTQYPSGETMQLRKFWILEYVSWRPFFAYVLLLPLQFLGIYNAKNGLRKQIPAIGFLGDLWMKKKPIKLRKDDGLQSQRLKSVPILKDSVSLLCMVLLILAVVNEFIAIG